MKLQYHHSQLKTYDGDIQFIVSFGDGQFWTSPSYKKLLESAKQRNDKYFNIKTAKIVNLDGPTLGLYYNKNKFRVGELYSEVAITKSITNAQEMLTHIDWLCTQGKFFRNTEVGQPINAKGKSIPGIGSWMVNHDKEGNFALEYQDQFNQVQEDKVYAEQQLTLLHGKPTKVQNIVDPIRMQEKSQ